MNLIVLMIQEFTLMNEQFKLSQNADTLSHFDYKTFPTRKPLRFIQQLVNC